MRGMEMGRNPSLYVTVGIIAILAIGSLFAIQESSGVDPSETLVIERDGMVYELDPGYGYNRSATVMGVADGFDSSDIVIPSKITHESHDYRVRNIADDAFRDQTGLVSVELPQSMTSIGDGVFAGCTSLVDINIPYMVTELRETFAGCTSLESIMLTGNYYTTDLYGTFAGCTSLRDVCIRWTANVWDDTFAGCESLVNIETYQIARFGDRSFMGCTSLERLDVRSGVYYIGESAFEGCTSLTSVDIVERENLTIGDRAFADCMSLTTITLPDNLAFIGKNVFKACPALESIHIAKSNPAFLIENGVLFDKGKSKLIQYPAGKEGSSFHIPDGVTTIGGGAFSECSRLSQIILPSSVTTIEESAFENCGISQIFISEHVSAIKEDAFTLARSLTSIDVDTNNPNYCSEDGVLFNKDKTKLLQFPSKKQAISYTVPEGVTSIGYGAFAANSLSQILLPHSLTAIGKMAFFNCLSLKNITIPQGVTSIDKFAFYGCEALRNVNIPQGITVIRHYTFADCKSLSRIDVYPLIPPTIEPRAFDGVSPKLTVKVPKESLEAYKNAPEWKNFKKLK